MKCKYILHIPTGLYFNYAYYPKSDRDKQVCCCLLTVDPPKWRKDDTAIFKHFEKWQYEFSILAENDETGRHDGCFNEFTLLELEIYETKI